MRSESRIVEANIAEEQPAIPLSPQLRTLLRPTVDPKNMLARNKPLQKIACSAQVIWMMDKIWHLRGANNLPSDVSDTIIFERLENFLAKQRKPITEQTASSIEFSSPLWEDIFTPNWLALVVYDQGKFWIENGLEGRSLRYDLRSWHALIFCFVAALMFLIFVGTLEDIATGGKIALLAFAWLYGGNMMLAWARVPFAIRKALNGS